MPQCKFSTMWNIFSRKVALVGVLLVVFYSLLLHADFAVIQSNITSLAGDSRAVEVSQRTTPKEPVLTSTGTPESTDGNDDAESFVEDRNELDLSDQYHEDGGQEKVTDGEREVTMPTSNLDDDEAPTTIEPDHEDLFVSEDKEIGDVELDAETDTDIEPDTTLSEVKVTKRPNVNDRKNVVFLMADDMRPQLGAYMGDDHPTPFNQRKMHTPNFDRLANMSMTFGRAYVQYSLCGPSRTSMLTSRRPDTTRVFGNFHYWRVAGGNFTTLPQYFKEHGYKTIGIGKVFHPSVSSNNSDPISWTEPFYSVFTDRHYQGPNPGWRAVEPRDRVKVPLTDEYAVTHTLTRLRDLAPRARSGEQPFFLALGFRKPHISLVCPKEYHKLYELETARKYMSDIEWQTPHVAFPMENATLIDGKYVIAEDQLRNLRRAYFACISYVDDLLGDILDELESLKLMDNTVISFVADHGYHLGENDHWGKYIPSEMANHVPMMIRVPGITDNGGYSRSLVEALDMFPTIVEAAGLPSVPECPHSSSSVATCTEGISLMSVLRNPELSVRGAAISELLRGNHCIQYSMRTDRYRYVAYARPIHEEKPNGLYNIFYEWNPSDFPLELYDHQIDPEERVNRSKDPAYQSVVRNLQSRIEQRISPLYDVPVKIP